MYYVARYVCTNPVVNVTRYVYFNVLLPEIVWSSKQIGGYLRGMHLRSEHQALVDFFADRNLPTGPQHVNEYSVFFNLSGAVTTRISQLSSDVEATRNSAALMLEEVKNWLTTKELT